MRRTFLVLPGVVVLAAGFSSSPGAPQSASAKRGAAGLLVVVNKDSAHQSLSLIDPDSGQTIATVQEKGTRGHEVIVSPDGRLAYVPIYGDSGVGAPGTDGRSIEMVDLSKKSLVGEIDLGRPVRPHCPKFGPDGLLYVTAELANSVDVIDPRTDKRVASIPTSRPESHMLAITRDARLAYTSNVGSGTVSVLDLRERKTLAVIPVSSTAQRISLSTDDRYVFTADQKQPRLAVIDTAKNQVTNWIALPSAGYGTAPTSDGKWLLVALRQSKQVAVVDLKTMKVDRVIEAAKSPEEVLMWPDRPVAFVSCSGAGKIAVINLDTWKVDKFIDTPAPDGLAWAAAH